MKHAGFGLFACMVLSASALPACSSSPPPRLYIIEPLAVAASPLEGPGLSIAVGAVVIPAYLDRKEIVTRDRRYEINSAKFDRWAEPLDQNIANTLAENLSVLIPSDRVVAYPWGSVREFDYTVRVRVVRFGASPDGDVELGATWTIINSDNVTIAMTRTHYVVNRSGDDIRGLVAAMSTAIEELSRDIANALVVGVSG